MRRMLWFGLALIAVTVGVAYLAAARAQRCPDSLWARGAVVACRTATDPFFSLGRAVAERASETAGEITQMASSAPQPASKSADQPGGEETSPEVKELVQQIMDYLKAGEEARQEPPQDEATPAFEDNHYPYHEATPAFEDNHYPYHVYPSAEPPPVAAGESYPPPPSTSAEPPNPADYPQICPSAADVCPTPVQEPIIVTGVIESSDDCPKTMPPCVDNDEDVPAVMPPAGEAGETLLRIPCGSAGFYHLRVTSVGGVPAQTAVEAQPDQAPDCKEDPNYDHHYPGSPYTGHCPYTGRCPPPVIKPEETPKAQEEAAPDPEDKPAPEEGMPEGSGAEKSEYIIEPPDVLMIECDADLPDGSISGEHLVRPDGTISLGTYGEVPVGGHSLRDAQALIEETVAAQLLVSPQTFKVEIRKVSFQDKQAPPEQAPECPEETQHHQHYPCPNYCPYTGRCYPKPEETPKDGEQKPQAPPEEEPVMEEECPQSKPGKCEDCPVHPEVDTTEFRPEEDAREGEFNPQPM